MAIKKFYPATLDNQTAIIEKLDALQRDAIPVGSVEFHTLKISGGNRVELKWKDPHNREVSGVFLSYWAKTVIGAKRGGAPATLEDCDEILYTSIQRDAFLHEPLVVTLENAAEYTIKAFPVATNGAVNEADDNVFRSYWLYGFKVDDRTAVAEDEKITYTDDNADFEPAHRTGNGGEVSLGNWEGNTPFMPEPWMMLNDGTLDYRLDPSDYAKKADGTASDVANASYNGNAMMVWREPVFWKCTLEDQVTHYQFSNVKLDEGFECWNAKKHDGTYGMFAIGIYPATGSSSKTRSISSGGKPLTSTTATIELAAANANGEGWYPTTLPDIQLMRLLGLLVFKRTDMQSALGTRYVNGASSTASMANVGSLNGKGLFYGEGWDGNTNATVGTKFFGFENFWGEVNNRIIGATINAGKYLIKLTPSGIDGTTGGFVTDDSAAYAGYLDAKKGVYATNYSANFIQEMHHEDHCNMLPYLAGASSSTGYCDGVWTSTGLCQLVAGGNVSTGLTAGLFYSSLAVAPSYASWNRGSRLSYHPF